MAIEAIKEIQQRSQELRREVFQGILDSKDTYERGLLLLTDTLDVSEPKGVPAASLLDKVKEDPLTRKVYLFGLRGGIRMNPNYHQDDEYWQVLYRIAPEITNLHLLSESFGNPRFSVVSNKKYFAEQAFRGVLLEYGLSAESPECIAAELSKMHLNAKRFIYLPILGVVDRLIQASNPKITITRFDPDRYKVRFIERVLRGDDAVANRSSRDIKVDDLGSEVWRGLYTTVGRVLTKYIIENFPGEDPRTVAKSFGYLAFLRTSHREQGARSSDYWRRFIPLLKDRQFVEVEQLVREIGQENPQLFPDYIIEKMGIDRAVATRERAIKELQIIKEEEIRKREREAKKQGREEVLRLKKEQEKMAERDPALWEQLQPYIGKLGRVEGLEQYRYLPNRGVMYVLVHSQRQIKPRGKNAQPESGFVLVKYMQEDGKGGYKDVGHGICTYKKALGLVTKNNVVFPSNSEA